MRLYAVISVGATILLLWLLHEANEKGFLLPAIILAVVGAILALCLLRLIEGK